MSKNNYFGQFRAGNREVGLV